jgi:Mce-associated membrane protein
VSAVEPSTEVIDADEWADGEPALTPLGRAGVDSSSDGEGSTATGPDSSRPRRHRAWASIFGYRVVPAIVLLIALGAAYLRYGDTSARGAELARIESVQAAKDGAVAMLSYTPGTAEATLTAAQQRLTGAFRDSYASLTHDVVIPGAIQKQVTATATVRAAAVESATASHAVVLAFVNQAIVVGPDTPSDTASAVEITLDKVKDRWLISGFEPK